VIILVGRIRSHPPFLVTLNINHLSFHNSSLNFEDTVNVMTMHSIKELRLRITGPYKNICNMDSKKNLVCRIIEDLEASLEKFPNVSFLIDVVAIDVPKSWGLLLSRDWVSEMRGSVHYNYSYIIIPNPKGDPVVLYPKAPIKE
jgi:hypothetical protein